MTEILLSFVRHKQDLGFLGATSHGHETHDWPRASLNLPDEKEP